MINSIVSPQSQQTTNQKRFLQEKKTPPFVFFQENGQTSSSLVNKPKEPSYTIPQATIFSIGCTLAAICSDLALSAKKKAPLSSLKPTLLIIPPVSFVGFYAGKAISKVQKQYGSNNHPAQQINYVLKEMGKNLDNDAKVLKQKLFGKGDQ